MSHTYLSHDAVRRLRQGAAELHQQDLLSVEGEVEAGQAVEMRDPDGRPLGVADLDLDGEVTLRPLGQLHESADGLVPRQIRRALARRSQVVDDPRYCRLVHEAGDGLFGLVVDRFDSNFVVQTTTRAMDARIEEITRALCEIAGARGVILRNDSRRRERAGLKKDRSRVLFGAPPRWTRIQELGARLTVDLHQGFDTAYSYAMREVRRTVGRLARNARVLDPACFMGGTIIQAGLHGARQIVAYSEDPDALDLARENVEANGLINQVLLRESAPLTALRELSETFDLVVLHVPPAGLDAERWTRELDELIRLSLRATRHGGRLIIAAPELALGAVPLEEHVVRDCEAEGRAAYRLLRPAAPADFPAVAGAPEALASVVLEIT